MDARKKLIKLFKDIEQFIKDEKLKVTPYNFLFNKLFFLKNDKEADSFLLQGISFEDFKKIEKRFHHRLKTTITKTLSLSQIATLPEKTLDLRPLVITEKSNLLFLDSKISLNTEFEPTKGKMFFSDRKKRELNSQFSNLKHIKFNENFSLENDIQSTIFDLFEERNDYFIPNHYFEYIFLSDISKIEISLLKTIKNILSLKGKFVILVKNIFFSSSKYKKQKKLLYDFFELKQINKTQKELLVFFQQKQEKTETTVTITDTEKTLKVPKNLILSNPLLTFDDSIDEERLKLIQKIEKTAQKTAKDYFKFFIGIFVWRDKQLAISDLRRNFRYEPLVFPKEIIPFKPLMIKKWFLLEKNKIVSMPPIENFKQKKLIFRYYSIEPKAIYDEKKLLFLSDLAGVFPKTNEILLEFAEFYFNSKLINFYYKNKFPHNNKFLKKNFHKIPFFRPSLNIQKIIVEEVKQLKENSKQKETFDKMKQKLNKYIYQMFKLTQKEINIIEKF